LDGGCARLAADGAKLASEKAAKVQLARSGLRGSCYAGASSACHDHAQCQPSAGEHSRDCFGHGGHVGGAGDPIKVQLREIAQLFNSMDPSPFHDRDLDADAEEFILSWAREVPPEHEVELVIHLETMPSPERAAGVEQAVKHYFAQRAEIKQREYRQLLRHGRISLLVSLRLPRDVSFPQRTFRPLRSGYDGADCEGGVHHRRLGGDVETVAGLSL
jgi:hypothetical protein